MRIIVIADVHGRQTWKKAKNISADRYIFLGDYFDSRDNIPTVSQIRNFKEIADWAKKDSRVDLLTGNHDFHYLRGFHGRYSGFQQVSYFDIQEVLEENKHLLRIAYQSGNYVFSHAGFSKTWMNDAGISEPMEANILFRKSYSPFEFNGIDPYGDDVTQGPTWIRPYSLKSDAWGEDKGIIQIVGHTQVSNPTKVGPCVLADTANNHFVIVDSEEGLVSFSDVPMLDKI